MDKRDVQLFKAECPFRENELATVPGLAALHRQLSRLNPGQHKRQAAEQFYINVPLLYLASLLLHRFAARRGCDTFLFATRDCVHFATVFASLFPQYRVHYFHCSRVMFSTAGRSYQEYVESTILGSAKGQGCKEHQLQKAIKKTVFVDLHGTGRHTLTYFQDVLGYMPYVYLLSASCADTRELPAISQDYLRKGIFFLQVMDVKATPIEMLNYDMCGSLQRFSKRKGPIRDPPEYDLALIAPYHDSVRRACALIKPWQGPVDYDMVEFLFRKVVHVVHQDRPYVAQFIKHVANHKHKDE